MRSLFLLGRTLFGGFFVYNGLHHFMQAEALSQYASAKGVPSAAATVRGSGALMLAGGLSVIGGVQPRAGLAAIVAFLLPVTAKMHRFWEIEDPQQRAAESVNFAKNVALLGAALMMMQLAEPWPDSIDAAREGGEEMYIRLGSSELVALPS